MRAQLQGDQPGDERRGRGRATEVPVAPAEHRRHVAAGSRDAHPWPVVRPGVALVGNRRRGDAERAGIGRRVELRARARIPRRGNDDHASAGRVADRARQLGARARTAETQVDHLCAVIGRPHDAGGDQRVVAAAVRVEHLHRHDRAAPADPCTAEVVVGSCRDDPSHGRTVAVVVHRIRVRVDEVVAGNESAPQVGVLPVDARVEDRDDDPARALRDIPGGRESGDAQSALLGPGTVVRRDVGLVLQCPPSVH